MLSAEGGMRYSEIFKCHERWKTIDVAAVSIKTGSMLIEQARFAMLRLFLPCRLFRKHFSINREGWIFCVDASGRIQEGISWQIGLKTIHGR